MRKVDHPSSFLDVRLSGRLVLENGVKLWACIVKAGYLCVLVQDHAGQSQKQDLKVCPILDG